MVSMLCPVFLESDNDTSWNLATNEGGGNELGRKVTRTANKCMKTLLEQPFAIFLNTVRTNASILKFLDSYLRHRERDLDKLWKMDTDAQADDFATSGTLIVDKRKQTSLLNLDRRVLLVYHRLSTRDGGAVSLRNAKAAAGGKDYDKVLYDEWVLDVPKMLDICSLYGRKYKMYVQEMLTEMFMLQPAYLDDLKQAMIYTTKALGKSYKLIDTLSGSATEEVRANANRKSKDGVISSEQKTRESLCDVVKYVTDILNTVLVLSDTVPTIFAHSLADVANWIDCLSPFVHAALRTFETSLDMSGGVTDSESNAIHMVRSLAIRVAFAVVDQRVLKPLEKWIPGTTPSQQSSSDSKERKPYLDSSFKWDLATLQVDVFNVMHPLAFREDLDSIRVALQMHYNIAGRLLSLVDATVIERRSATAEAAAKILEAAPIPADIMAPEEKVQETEVEIAVSKHETTGRHNVQSAKMRRKQFSAASRASGGGDRLVNMEGSVFSETDEKLRDAMRAILSRYDGYEADDFDVDDSLDGPMLRMPSGDPAYSSEDVMEEDSDLASQGELLEVRKDKNGIQTGIVRDASGKKVEVLMPNTNRQTRVNPSSRGGRRGGGGGRGGKRHSGPSKGASNRKTGKIAAADPIKKKKVSGEPGGGIGNAKGTAAASARTRRRNERHKSSRANHSRKRGAAKKAARGMF